MVTSNLVGHSMRVLVRNAHYITTPISNLVSLPCCSFDGKYFASLGGQDDNSVVIWEAKTGRAVCGSPAAQDSALSVKWLHRRNDRFVTAGNFHLRVWQVDVSIPKASECHRQSRRERGRKRERRVGKEMDWNRRFACVEGQRWRVDPKSSPSG